MDRRRLLQGMGVAAIVPFLSAAKLHAESEAWVDDAATVFELRVYHTHEGKLELLLKRFRERETRIFERLGMRGVGYWTPTDEPLKGRTLIYLLAHRSREAATASWERFKVDPEWVKLKAESEAGGEFVEKHESTFMALTDFSPKA